MENTAEQEFKKNWDKSLRNTHISLYCLAVIVELDSLINKVDVSGAKNDCEFESMVAYAEGLKKAVEVIREKKNYFNK